MNGATQETPESLAKELERIQALDQRDGYQDEPLEHLIAELNKRNDCDDLLSEALYQQATCQVYQSNESLLKSCEQLLVRLNQHSNEILYLKALNLLAFAQYKLNKNTVAISTLDDLIRRCKTIINQAKNSDVAKNIEDESNFQLINALFSRATYAEDKQSAMDDYAKIIEMFEASTEPRAVEKVAHSRYQLGLINLHLGNEQLGRYHLQQLCDMKLVNSGFGAVWVERAKQRLKLI